MKTLLKYTAVVIVSQLFQQCSFSQNNPSKNNSTMDTTKKNNPVYSNIDTSKVTLTEEEGILMMKALQDRYGN